MLNFIVRILGNGLAIYLANYFVPGFSFAGGWKSLLLAGLLLALINAVLKPVLKFISTPLRILTLGLFTLVINIGLLWLLAQFLPELKISGIWAYVWGVLIVSVINWLMAGLGKKPKEQTNKS